VSARTHIRLTEEGKRWLEQEIQTLRNEKIPELEAIVLQSAQDGDMTDNSEWEESKDELARAQRRLEELGQVLASAQIITAGSVDGVVDVGSRVTVRPVSGDDFTWQVVDPIELPVADERISADSPVGRALLGTRVGDSASVRTPDGDVTYTVVAVD
jgi:transcription elongation factor GreA